MLVSRLTETEKAIGGFNQVWCDVGGTFTDCFVANEEGDRRSIKVLSTGLTKGMVSRWTANDCFFDPSRQNEPDNFWKGSTLNWVNEQGDYFHQSSCVESRSNGEIRIQQAPGSELIQRANVRYEIDVGLEAPVLATRLHLGLAPSQPLPPLSVRLGTTRGTNALLTRTGARCALVTTQGFADLLEIGYQERPDLFALNVRKRVPLYSQVIEIPERLNADGSVLRPIDLIATESVLKDAFDQGIRSIAICLIHSYCNPVHEKEVERIAAQIGFECVRASSAVAPKMQAVSRAETTLVDAYLTPVIQSYLSRVTDQFGGSERTTLRMMTSAGGLASAAFYSGKDSVLSGPAGGAVAIEAYSKSLGIPKTIGLDMGGTSTDVCRVEGTIQLENETIKAGVRMMIPTLAIHTVAAGGGSICWFDGVQLRVGPQSAGSAPGPASYGNGGPLTVTDLNVLAGRIDCSSFPFALDAAAAKQRLNEVLMQMQASSSANARMTLEELREGFRRIANEHMAAAVRNISIAQGADPREHVLVGFGGAAGQHICEIADLLGMTNVIDPPEAGLLSALGMGMASVRRSYTSPIYQELKESSISPLNQAIKSMRSVAKADLGGEGMNVQGIVEKFQLELRYVATEGTISVPLPTSLPQSRLDDPSHRGSDRLVAETKHMVDMFTSSFEVLYKKRFGTVRSGKGIEVVAIHGEFTIASRNKLSPNNSQMEERLHAGSMRDSSKPNTDYVPGTPAAFDNFFRDKLTPNQHIKGPALIVSSGSTTFVDREWTAEVLADKTLSLKRSHSHSPKPPHHTALDGSLAMKEMHPDPVLREVLAQRIASIADQMGIVLEQTAISVNVKDRRDFSCAVFDAKGELIANAPHVPVHLGAMSETIRCVVQLFPQMYPGDCYVTNDPYQGGSHLPDITVITPVFARPSSDRMSSSVDFFVACRAHHAEIGGIAPGSMAPTSKCLGEEGVILLPMKLVDAGVDRSEDVEILLKTARYPSRSVRENMADLAAQQAANQRGLQAITELAQQVGVDVLQEYMQHIQAASQAKTEAWIQSLGTNVKAFQDCMDDGTTIAVRVQATKNAAGRPILDIDFTGTGPVSNGNLNANPAIVSAAIMYVIRCALDDTLPLNSGVLRCARVTIPNGILNPFPPDRTSDKSLWPAVAGGNVETSQRVVDCLLGALGLAAASQGTMNNFLFGNKSFGYYETIGGGTGATKESDGADAVHSHMTNTRLTDVEVLEKRYPVRLVRFEVRKGSGGQGKHRGGNGMIRQIEALEPLEVSLVTSRRNTKPFGVQSGGPGASGENWLILCNGLKEELNSACQLQIQPGDCIQIRTPGGGGFG